jgi:hypothetical protein
MLAGIRPEIQILGVLVLEGFSVIATPTNFKSTWQTGPVHGSGPAKFRMGHCEN